MNVLRCKKCKSIIEQQQRTSWRCWRKQVQNDTCFLQHLHKVLCCCSGIDLHFSHQSMFISRRQNASPSRAVWRLRGPMVFILAYCCLYRWMWFHQAFGNCHKDEPDLWRSKKNSEVFADLFCLYHHVKRRGTEFEGRPLNTSTGTPSIDSNDVN